MFYHYTWDENCFTLSFSIYYWLRWKLFQSFSLSKIGELFIFIYAIFIYLILKNIYLLEKTYIYFLCYIIPLIYMPSFQPFSGHYLYYVYFHYCWTQPYRERERVRERPPRPGRFKEGLVRKEMEWQAWSGRKGRKGMFHVVCVCLFTVIWGRYAM